MNNESGGEKLNQGQKIIAEFVKACAEHDWSKPFVFELPEPKVQKELEFKEPVFKLISRASDEPQTNPKRRSNKETKNKTGATAKPRGKRKSDFLDLQEKLALIRRTILQQVRFSNGTMTMSVNTRKFIVRSLQDQKTKDATANALRELFYKNKAKCSMSGRDFRTMLSKKKIPVTHEILRRLK